MLASNERNIKKNAKRNNTENSDNVLDFTIGDCFFTQKDSVRQQCVSKGESNVIQMPVLFLTLNYKILNFLETATLFSLSSLKSPFMKKRWEEKNHWSQFSCWFTQQSAEAYSLWRRNNKAREGCVPLRINQRATWRGSLLYHVPGAQRAKQMVTWSGQKWSGDPTNWKPKSCFLSRKQLFVG